MNNNLVYNISNMGNIRQINHNNDHILIYNNTFPVTNFQKYSINNYLNIQDNNINNNFINNSIINNNFAQNFNNINSFPRSIWKLFNSKIFECLTPKELNNFLKLITSSFSNIELINLELELFKN